MISGRFGVIPRRKYALVAGIAGPGCGKEVPVPVRACRPVWHHWLRFLVERKACGLAGLSCCQDVFGYHVYWLRLLYILFCYFEIRLPCFFLLRLHRGYFLPYLLLLLESVWWLPLLLIVWCFRSSHWQHISSTSSPIFRGRTFPNCIISRRNR